MDGEEGPARASGACVLVALAAVVVGIVFSVSTTAGVLGVWLFGAVILYRSARRGPRSVTPPPPRGVTPSGDVYAGETGRVDRVESPGSGALTIIYPERQGVSQPGA